MNYSTALPSVIRRLISERSLSVPTYGLCNGYLQANISIVPAHVADDFENFCRLNASACPLLYRSKPGEFGVPILAKDSDIRTQLPKYWHMKNGQFYEDLTNLTSFEWKDMVTFYLGCSFGMEDAFKDINIVFPKEKTNVSMYISNIPCNRSGPFSTNMVVSMRSVPKERLQALFEASYTLDCCHGAPIHIGDPLMLGITDVLKVDFGDVTAIGDDEVPVFFACGVTGTKAIESAGLPQCFSHSPGHMFICDVKTAEFQDLHPVPYQNLVPSVVQISEKRFSVLSETAKTNITRLEKCLLCDIGKRGVEHLSVKDNLLKSLLRLYQASSIGITFGFPVFPKDPVSEETDGLPGALAIVKALCALGKKVSFIIDSRNEGPLKKILEKCLKAKILNESIPVLVYHRQSERVEEAMKFLYPTGSDDIPQFDHLVSIERTGPSKDGSYRNMRGRELDEKLIAPIEDLFLQAAKDYRISTTSIGDGGNELGMGKVKKQVVQHGETIACEVSSDYLITAGVSNWGGYALAVGLYLLYTCPIHMRYVRRGLEVDEEDRRREDFLNSVEQEAEILQMVVDEGFRDGVNGKMELSVDDFEFYPHHAEQIKKFHSVLN